MTLSPPAKYIIFFVLASTFAVYLSYLLADVFAENSLIFSIYVFLIFAFFPQVMKGIQGKFDPLSIDFLFVCGFTLYSLIEPIRAVMGWAAYHNGMDYVVFLETIALCSFYLGYFYLRGTKLEAEGFVLTDRHKNIIWLVIILGAVMTLIYFVGVDAFSGKSKAQLSLVKKSRPWLASFGFGAKFVSAGLLMLFLLWLKQGKLKFIKKVYTLIVLVYFSTFMIVGERGEIFLFLCSLFLIVHYRYKRIKTIPFFFLAMIGYFIFITSHYLKGKGSLYDMLMYFFTNAKVEWYIDLRSEFSSAARNLYALIQYVPDQVNYLWGKTFISVITNFVPASIWPNRPTNAVGWFNRTFYEGVVNIGGGRGFTLVGEGYANFGIIGIILLFVVLGIACKFLYLKVRHSNSDFWMIAYAGFIPILIYSIRADVTNLTSQFFKGTAIPFLLIILLTKIATMDRGHVKKVKS